MMRVGRHHATMALEVLEGAKDAGDEWVAAACRRIRQAWFSAKPVAQEDIALVEAFGEAMADARGASRWQ
jgi:5-formaminoimidazole-4-carboxamide-1-beta-D-ribofuranosyl 5'-monophosphate synthetase